MGSSRNALTETIKKHAEATRLAVVAYPAILAIGITQAVFHAETATLREMFGVGGGEQIPVVRMHAVEPAVALFFGQGAAGKT